MSIFLVLSLLMSLMIPFRAELSDACVMTDQTLAQRLCVGNESACIAVYQRNFRPISPMLLIRSKINALPTFLHITYRASGG